MDKHENGSRAGQAKWEVVKRAVGRGDNGDELTAGKFSFIKK